MGFGVLWDAQSWPTQSLCTQIPVLGSASHWEQADVGTARVGGISLGKCFALSITARLLPAQEHKALAGCGWDARISVLLWPLSTWQGWQEWHGGIPCTWHRDGDSWQRLKP